MSLHPSVNGGGGATPGKRAPRFNFHHGGSNKALQAIAAEAQDVLEATSPKRTYAQRGHGFAERLGSAISRGGDEGTRAPSFAHGRAGM